MNKESLTEYQIEKLEWQRQRNEVLDKIRKKREEMKKEKNKLSFTLTCEAQE